MATKVLLFIPKLLFLEEIKSVKSLKYFLHLAYNGTRYHGWQRQPKSISVQQVLEEAMIGMLKEDMHLSSCSRTDAGVHSCQFFAHFKTEKELTEKHVGYLNKILPADISVFDIILVHRSAHAQKDVIARTYDYFLHFYKDPMLCNKSTFYDLQNLDFDKMHEACELLLATKDFRSLSKSPDKYSSTLCDLTQATIFVHPNQSRMRLRVTSDRFLQGMIRLIVGRLLQIGTGKLTLSKFSEILAAGESIPSKLATYPQGLYLSKVKYEYITLNQTNSFIEFLSQDLVEMK